MKQADASSPLNARSPPNASSLPNASSPPTAHTCPTCHANATSETTKEPNSTVGNDTDEDYYDDGNLFSSFREQFISLRHECMWVLSSGRRVEEVIYAKCLFMDLATLSK